MCISQLQALQVPNDPRTQKAKNKSNWFFSLFLFLFFSNPQTRCPWYLRGRFLKGCLLNVFDPSYYRTLYLCPVYAVV